MRLMRYLTVALLLLVPGAAHAAQVHANLVCMNTSSTGTTSPITLTTAVDGYLTAAEAGIADGSIVSYGITDSTESEVSRGVYSSTGTTLTRPTTFTTAAGGTGSMASTNADGLISLTGSATVCLTPIAEDITDRLPINVPDLGGIYDANGNEMLLFDTVTSAVNYLTMKNAITGTRPAFGVGGPDADGFDFIVPGTPADHTAVYRSVDGDDVSFELREATAANVFRFSAYPTFSEFTSSANVRFVTSADDNMEFWTNNTSRWFLGGTTGDLLPSASGLDIGSETRPVRKVVSSYTLSPIHALAGGL